MLRPLGPSFSCVPCLLLTSPSLPTCCPCVDRQTCLSDKKKFCPNVKPGANRAKDCLEDNMAKAGFTEGCKKELEEAQERRAADFRLDAHLRDLCIEDIEDICGYEKESLDSIAGFDGRVSNCLMDYREEILKPECKTYVHKLIEGASKNIRLNIPLADACFDDRENLCKDVQPGSANVIRCLQDQREQLTFECRATLFDMEVRMSESLDFQYPLKAACTNELRSLCKDVPAVNSQAIKCLQTKIENADMGGACKEEVQRQQQRENEDYRLNFRLNRACEVDVDELCADVCSPFAGQACGGTVLRCLSEKREKVRRRDHRETGRGERGVERERERGGGGWGRESNRTHDPLRSPVSLGSSLLPPLCGCLCATGSLNPSSLVSSLFLLLRTVLLLLFESSSGLCCGVGMEG